MAAEERARDAVQLIAACLMPDHFHAVVRPSRQAIVPWVNSFKSITTRASWRAGWRGGIWQPSFYDRRIRDSEFSETLAYVVMNPVVAGLAEEWVAWPWVWVEPGS